MRIPPKVVSMAVPDAGGKKGVAPLNKGLSPQVTGGGQTGIVISTEQSEWRNL